MALYDIVTFNTADQMPAVIHVSKSSIKGHVINQIIDK